MYPMDDMDYDPHPRPPPSNPHHNHNHNQAFIFNIPLCCACLEVTPGIPGCAADEECEFIVCLQDEFCCGGQWDIHCVTQYAQPICNENTLPPTNPPTKKTTRNPTRAPTMEPTINPTIHPTIQTTINPTLNPTIHPTHKSIVTKSPTNEYSTTKERASYVKVVF